MMTITTENLTYPLTFETHTPEETEAVGAAFAARLLQDAPRGAFCAMYGDLGAGKTAFVRGAAQVLAPASHIQSPTYSIVNEYRSGKAPLFHFDMYRIEDEDSLDSIGYWDYPERGGYCFVEWSEHIGYALPDDYYKITIRKDAGDAGLRTIRIELVSR